MNQHVYIMQGLPGSGKSTYAKNLLREVEQDEDYPGLSGVIVSADHFFEKNGVYTFDASKIGEAHGRCLRTFYEMVEAGNNGVIVDNTNLTVVEVAPYIAIAQAFGYSVEIHRMDTSLGACLAHNAHNVPAEVVESMAQKLFHFPLAAPPWWPKAKMIARKEV